MNIKIYSTPVCVYCNMLKKYLDDKGVQYEAIDVSQDQAAAEEISKKSGQMGVPVTIINTDDNQEEIIVGFDKARIDKLISA